MATAVKITAEPQMDPNVCRFYIDQQIHDGLFNCRTKSMAEGSPLLEALFKVPGVIEILVTGNTLTIAKKGDEPWQAIGKQVGTIIREKIAEGGTLIDPNVADKQPASDELRRKIQEVFDSEVNPGIASHGGSVEIIDLQGTTLFLSMSGGCQGCASASYTLRNGIEQILRERVPEITDIVDVTDHASGDNPYY